MKRFYIYMHEIFFGYTKEDIEIYAENEVVALKKFFQYTNIPKEDKKFYFASENGNLVEEFNARFA